jgi:hypothetical protein
MELIFPLFILTLSYAWLRMLITVHSLKATIAKQNNAIDYHAESLADVCSTMDRTIAFLQKMDIRVKENTKLISIATGKIQESNKSILSIIIEQNRLFKNTETLRQDQIRLLDYSRSLFADYVVTKNQYKSSHQ